MGRWGRGGLEASVLCGTACESYRVGSSSCAPLEGSASWPGLGPSCPSFVPCLSRCGRRTLVSASGSMRYLDSPFLASWLSDSFIGIASSRPRLPCSCGMAVTNSMGDGDWGLWNFQASLSVSFIEPWSKSSSSLLLIPVSSTGSSPPPGPGDHCPDWGTLGLGAGALVRRAPPAGEWPELPDLVFCFFLLEFLLYLLGPHLLEDGAPRCAFFSRLFRALRRGQSFPQVSQSFFLAG